MPNRYGLRHDEQERAEERRRNIDQLQRRKDESERQVLDRRVRDAHNGYVANLRETDAATHQGTDREEAARRQAFADEQERDAKRQREIDQIAEQQKADDREASARAGAATIHSAEDRAAQALGRYYDITRPYQSLAASAMHEHELFMREREQLRRESAAEKDPVQRRILELQDRAESHQYLAHLHHRSGRLAEPMTDRQTPQERLYDAHREGQTGERGNAQARPDFEARDKHRALAAETLHERHALIERAERERMDRERAGEIAHTQRTQQERTQAGPPLDSKFVAEMNRRREAANFRPASKEDTKTRDREGQEREAREDDGGRSREQQRDRDRGRGR